MKHSEMPRESTIPKFTLHKKIYKDCIFRNFLACLALVLSALFLHTARGVKQTEAVGVGVTAFELKDSKERVDQNHKDYVSNSAVTNEDCWLLDYVDYHNRERKRLEQREEVKALVYICHYNCGGLGDRVSGIVSAFYAAVAMRRLFIIDSSYPVPLNLTLRPTDSLNWDIKKFLPADTLKWNIMHIFRRRKAVTINGSNSHNQQARVLNSLFAAHKSGVSVIFFRINRLHVGMNLWKHSSATTRNSNMPEGHLARLRDVWCCKLRPCAELRPSTLMKVAFNTLFTFSPQVLDRAFIMFNDLGLVSQEHGAMKNFVAIHARIGGQTKNLNSWYDPKRHSLDDMPEFLKCAHTLIANYSELRASDRINSPNIVVFSDSAEFRKRIVELDTTVKHTENTTIMHVDRSVIADRKTLESGVVDTYAELYVLSRATCIVGSKSTFSGVASSIFTPMSQSQRCYSYFKYCQDTTFDFWLSEGLK